MRHRGVPGCDVCQGPSWEGKTDVSTLPKLCLPFSRVWCHPVVTGASQKPESHHGSNVKKPRDLPFPSCATSGKELSHLRPQFPPLSNDRIKLNHYLFHERQSETI